MGKLKNIVDYLNKKNKKANNKYSYYIYDQTSPNPDIFWSPNSINKPHYKLFYEVYLPKFKIVDDNTFNVNFIDEINISAVVDTLQIKIIGVIGKNEEDSRFYIQSRTAKRLKNGYEVIYTLDVWLTYMYTLMFNMQDKRINIKVNRFLQNNLIKKWMAARQYKYYDELLDFSGYDNTILEGTNENAEPMKYGISIANFNMGWSASFVDQNDIDKIIGSSNTTDKEGTPSNAYITATNITRSTILWWVFKVGTDRFLAVAGSPYGASDTIYLKCHVSSDSLTFFSPISDTSKTYREIPIKIGWFGQKMADGAWINNFVGVFDIPFWPFISSNFITTPIKTLQTNYADGVILGFWWYRQEGIKLTSYYNKDFSFNKIVSGYAQKKQLNLPKNALLNNGTSLYKYETLIPFYSDNRDDYKLENNNYIYSKAKIDLVPYFKKPYGIDGLFIKNGADVNFDGNKFNIITNNIDQQNIIISTYGTKNVATDAYNQYLSTIKSSMNTSLEIAKNERDFQKSMLGWNTFKNVLGSAVNTGASFLTGEYGKAAGSLTGGLLGIGDTLFKSQQIDRTYNNTMKMQEAQLADKRRSLTTIDYNSSVSSDDYNITFLAQNGYNSTWVYNMNAFNNLVPKLNSNPKLLCKFPNSTSDRKYFNNLIWKMGIKAENFEVPAREAFEFEDPLNKFFYLDYSLDDDILERLFPSENLTILNAIKIIINNSARIWYEMPTWINGNKEDGGDNYIIDWSLAES